MQKNMCGLDCLINVKIGMVITVVKTKHHLVLTKKILNSMGFVARFALDE